MVVVLILLSQFKQDILIMSANFVDVMLIDADTASFLLTDLPEPGREGRGRRRHRAAAAGAVLVARSDSRAVAHRRRSARSSASPR